jgi:hypothetical protein
MSRPVGFRKISVDMPTAGVAVQLTSDRILCPSFEIHSLSGNAGKIYIGDSTVTNAWIPREQGGTWRFAASESGDMTRGAFFDLSTIYVVADTGGDDVIVQYVWAEN